MIIKKEFFKEVYLVEDSEKLTEKQWDNLLMSGKINWGQYFIPFKTKKEYEVIKDVEIIYFDFKSEMFKYIKKLDPVLLLNFSLEHEKPCVLKLI